MFISVGHLDWGTDDSPLLFKLFMALDSNVIICFELKAFGFAYFSTDVCTILHETPLYLYKLLSHELVRPPKHFPKMNSVYRR